MLAIERQYLNLRSEYREILVEDLDKDMFLNDALKLGQDKLASITMIFPKVKLQVMLEIKIFDERYEQWWIDVYDVATQERLEHNLFIF